MGERSEYAPGTFSWVDLSTTDQAGAKAFYEALFGWQAQDMPMGEDGGVYSIMQLGGRSVAAIVSQPEPQREAGVPPLWSSYVTVESADEAAQRAADLGATVHAPAFDVFDAGRMAVIQDPQGAYVMVWEPRGNIGAGLVNEPGALVWNELQSPDPDASASFYGEWLGWSVAELPGMEQRYLGIKVGERSNGGITVQNQPGVPPFWLVYFGIEDIDAGIAKVQELGGAKLAGPIDIQMAKLAIVTDPQGAVFALYAGELEP
jgi:predicted enzyme related to lactoylglutathione lyase